MKKHFITVIVIVMILLATPFAALAQSYSFSLDQENIIVFLDQNGTMSLDYTFVFTNDSGAHKIDFVDVGMPNGSFNIYSISADVNGAPVKVSESDYQGKGKGFAVVLGPESIQPGKSGTVHVTAEGISSALTRDSQSANYASFKFSPPWFDSKSVHGDTDLTVAFHLPPGVKSDEPRFHVPNAPWKGDKEPVTEQDENGRLVYVWHSENANGYTPYVFGASFPATYVPIYATQIARPTPETRSRNKEVPGCAAASLILVLIIAIGAFLRRPSFQDHRRDYPKPQISIEGHGIKRGLTAVEAGVVLEFSLEKILMMILFGVVKKGAAKIVKRDPLQLDIPASLPEDLRSYEKSFLDAFSIEKAREREEKLEEMSIALIKAVAEKLKGFDKDETQRYYRDMIQRAWTQVQEAGTPEVKNREFDQNFDWLIMNHRFGENVQKLFEDPGMTVPQWWSAYDQDFHISSPNPGAHSEESSSRAASRPAFEPPVFQSHSESVSMSKPEPMPTANKATSAPSSLPGAKFAASVVNNVQDISSRVVRDMGSFTDRVHEATDLQSIYSYWEESRASKRTDVENSYSERGLKSPDGFFESLFGSSSGDSGSHQAGSSSHRSSSSSSSSSHHSSCACACAGCACACAGGGR